MIFLVYLILTVSYFAHLNPKVPVPGLILFFLSFCHSFFFFFCLLLSVIPCQPGTCWLSQCVSETMTPLHFLWCLYSRFVLYKMKKGLIAQQILKTALYNIKGLTEIPWDGTLPIPFSRILTCCSFSLSLYSLQISASKLK